ncbi:MAG: hypothetical protein ACK46Q_05005 [Hyphomonas sp.]
MIPTNTFQDAVKAMLLADPVIAQHIAPAHIRIGTVRPTQLPAIIISPTRANILGRAAGGQIVAEVSLLVGVYASNTGEDDTSHTLGPSAFVALMDAPKASGFQIDEWERPSVIFHDQAASVGNASHNIISLRAVIRWFDQ